MVFLLFGLLLVALKLAGIEPVASLDWWWVLSPFAVAVLWWAWSDYSGRTSRMAAQQDEQRKAMRLEETRHRLHGTDPKSKP